MRKIECPCRDTAGVNTLLVSAQSPDLFNTEPREEKDHWSYDVDKILPHQRAFNLLSQLRRRSGRNDLDVLKWNVKKLEHEVKPVE